MSARALSRLAFEQSASFASCLAPREPWEMMINGDLGGGVSYETYYFELTRNFERGWLNRKRETRVFLLAEESKREGLLF